MDHSLCEFRVLDLNELLSKILERQRQMKQSQNPDELYCFEN
jgi:hypothetical protein